MASSEHDSSYKTNKRKHKAKSLVVSCKNSSNNKVSTDSISLSAECDSSTFGLRSFSFRRFGRGRSASKQSLNDLNSTTECASCVSPTTTTKINDKTNIKCPTITYNNDTASAPTSPSNPQIESKLIGSKFSSNDEMARYPVFRGIRCTPKCTFSVYLTVFSI